MVIGSYILYCMTHLLIYPAKVAWKVMTAYLEPENSLDFEKHTFSNNL